MSQAKAALHKHRKKGLPVLGAAGLSLCLGSGAPAALGVATTDIPACSLTVTEGHTLREEEFTDITLATFHIFGREEAPRPHSRIAGGACGACGSGLYEQPANNPPMRSMSPPAKKPPHPYAQTLKRPEERPQVSKHKREAGTRATNQNVTRQAQPEQNATRQAQPKQSGIRPAQPELDGLVVNQSAGQQAQPQIATPVTNSPN